MNDDVYLQLLIAKCGEIFFRAEEITNKNNKDDRIKLCSVELKIEASELHQNGWLQIFPSGQARILSSGRGLLKGSPRDITDMEIYHIPFLFHL